MIKMIKKVLVLCATTLALSGCFATAAKYNEKMSLYVGQHVDRVVIDFGQPNAVTQLSNGVLLEYNTSKTVFVGGYTYTQPEVSRSTTNGTSSGTITHQPNRFGSGFSLPNRSTLRGNSTSSTTTITQVQKTTPIVPVLRSCNTRFVVNTDNIVTSFSAKGNNCISQ